MGVKHQFVSSVPDIGGPTYVQPTHWNAPHNMPPVVVYDFDAGVAAASFGIPSTALTPGFEFPVNSGGLGRGGFDVTYLDNLRLGVGVASAWALGSVALRLQYMASGFPGSWYSFDATGGSGPFVSVASANTGSQWLSGSNGLVWGPTVLVSAAAKILPQPLAIRIAGYGGNGSAAAFGKIKALGF